MAHPQKELCYQEGNGVGRKEDLFQLHGRGSGLVKASQIAGSGGHFHQLRWLSSADFEVTLS